jgi:signal transduction histidine kinase
VSRRAGRLRTRLLAAMVVIAFGVLMITGIGTFALARRSNSKSALHDLRVQARQATGDLDTALVQLDNRTPNGGNGVAGLARFIGAALRLTNGSIVAVTPAGQVRDGSEALPTRRTRAPAAEQFLQVPSGLNGSELNSSGLLKGAEQSGVTNDLAYVAEPLQPLAGNPDTPVLVLTKKLDQNPFGRSSPFFLFTGAMALVAAVVVSLILARRMTRPLAAMEATADRIASGDLSARTGVSDHQSDELIDLGKSIDGMAEQLESARGLERAFLLSVSHDLRTPLTSIRGYAEALAHGAAETPEQRVRAAEIIEAEARRLERLVADLLELARLDTHQFSLTPRPIDARAVVAASVDGFRPSAQDLGVALECAPGPPIPVDADPERLGQIVANLMENALKYAVAEVSVEVYTTDGTVRLRVDDDGPGIAPADMPRVFDRLYTARPAPGRKVGTGLGLAIVRELASTMGGRAEVFAVDGRGTRFVVTIPAGPPPPSAPTAGATDIPPSAL